MWSGNDEGEESVSIAHRCTRREETRISRSQSLGGPVRQGRGSGLGLRVEAILAFSVAANWHRPTGLQKASRRPSGWGCPLMARFTRTSEGLGLQNYTYTRTVVSSGPERRDRRKPYDIGGMCLNSRRIDDTPRGSNHNVLLTSSEILTSD